MARTDVFLNVNGFKRHIGLGGLIMTSVGAMMGSGWLFSAYFAAKLAGAGALFSWLIGGAIMLLIALTFGELGSLFPKTGGIAKYLEYSHGSFVGFIGGWTNWLGIITTVSSEAAASTQYISFWSGRKALYDVSNGQLTVYGILATFVFLIFYLIINYWGIKLFIRFVSAITFFKIMIPILTVICLLYSGFHAQNFRMEEGFLKAHQWHTVLTTMITCGIIFSFYGFQSAINFSEEAKNPKVNVPLSVILSILFTLFIYGLLQLAFIGALPPDQLIKMGWKGIEFHSPFIQLVLLFNLHLMAILIYVNSVISPSGSGIIYMGSATRVLYGMEKHGYLPRFFGHLNPQYSVPRYGLFFNLLCASFFLFLFRGWGKIVGLISIINVASFIAGPIGLAALRRIAPNVPRIFKLPVHHLFCLPAFIIISFLIYWGSWPLTGKSILLLLIGVLIYFFFQPKKNWIDMRQHIKGGFWFIGYFIGMILISFLGQTDFGGCNLLVPYWDSLIIILFSTGIYSWAIHSAWKNPVLLNELEQC